MARTYTTISGTATNFYTVPTGKVAKVIIKAVVTWANGKKINIGQYTLYNYSGNTVNSSKGNSTTNSASTSSMLQSAQGFIMCSNADIFSSSVNVKEEHFLTAGETVGIDGGTLYITVIEEDA